MTQLSFGEAKFAFLIHPRSDLRGDLAKAVHPLLRFIPLPDSLLAGLIKFFPPLVSGKILLAGKHYGYIVFVPLTAKQMLAKGKRQRAVKKIKQAVRRAANKNCHLIGLGSLTAPLTLGGEVLKDFLPGVGITNGNALTAAATIQATLRLLEIFPFSDTQAKIAIVGATGSVGVGVSGYLATLGFDLLLLGRVTQNNKDFRSNAKLLKLYNELSLKNDRISASVQMEDLCDRDIVIVTTSASDTLIRREHLKSGAIVYDDTQPRNTDEALVDADDILVIDGGWLMAPGLEITVNIDLPDEHAYACLVETFLLALAGRFGNYCLGRVQQNQVEEMMRLFQSSDFQLARFRSFGKYVAQSKWEHMKNLIANNVIV